MSGGTAIVARPPILPDPRDRLLVVEASAGTGKTYFLEHRVIDLILAAGATIDQLLVVTFTEKATAELRARIRAKLAELAQTPAGDHAAGAASTWTIDDAPRARLRDALAGFDRAPIHTIHGFCQRLLVEDAFAGHRLFEQTQIPDDVAFAEAYRQTLRDHLARDPDESRWLRAYLETGGSTEQLGTILLSCARKDALVQPVLDVDALVDAADAYAAAVAALPPREPLQVRLEAQFGVCNAQSRKAMAARMVDLATRVAAADDAAGPGADRTARAIALCLALTPAKESKYLDVAVQRTKIPGPPPVGAAAIEAAVALVQAWVPLEASCAARFLPLVLTRVRAGKSRRGQFDYQDMLRLVRDVLRGDRGEELAARLRKRHPWAMIDEFQDTDEVQWEIFRRVWADHADARLAIVGDPKQAIYSFRGADVYTYLGARDYLMARDATRIPLVDNHRSTADLVDAVNALVGGMHGAFFSPDGDITYPVAEHVRAAGAIELRRASGAAMTPVHVFKIEPAEPGAPFGDDAAETLAERVAEEIRRLLAEPAHQLLLRDRRGERPLAPADIHVLTRTGKESDWVAAALRRRAVPCAVYQREHLFESSEAGEVADLLGAIADPRDRSARLLAWNTSFFGVPLGVLGELTDVPDGHPLVALLHDWRGLALRKAYDLLFARVLEDTRWVERTVVAGGGERAITNVLHLFELLHDEVARSPCEIHELAQRLRTWIRTGEQLRADDIDLQRLETERHSVQIMTIHRAKGLEAAVVFVAGGFGGSPPDQTRLYHDAARRRCVQVGTPLDDVAQRIEADRDEENQRLMYVAVTRAKGRLYLPLRSKLISYASIKALHGCVERAVLAHTTDPDAARLFSLEPVPVGSVRTPPPVEAAEDLRGWTPPPLPAPPPAAPYDQLRARQGGIVVTSYSRLRPAAARASDRDDVRAEQVVVALGDAPAVTADDLPAGAATGLFLHEALEHVPFASALAEPDAAAWARPARDRAGAHPRGATPRRRRAARAARRRAGPSHAHHGRRAGRRDAVAARVRGAGGARGRVRLSAGPGLRARLHRRAGRVGRAAVGRGLQERPLARSRARRGRAPRRRALPRAGPAVRDRRRAHAAAARRRRLRAPLRRAALLVRAPAAHPSGRGHVGRAGELDHRAGRAPRRAPRDRGGRRAMSRRPRGGGRKRATPAGAVPLFTGLSVGGALATRFGGAAVRAEASGSITARLIDGARRFDLGELGLYLAEEVVACDPFLGGPQRAAMAAALLATQAAARQGSTRVALDPRGPLRELLIALLGINPDDDRADARMIDELLAELVGMAGQAGFGGLIGGPGKIAPLIIDDDHLYQHRLWWLETQLAAALAARLRAAPLDDAAGVPAAVADVAARPGSVAITPQQAAAVRTALAGRLGIISGGPGSGKTTIVVSLVRALARLGVTAGGIALAAPTGKAAARMGEAVARELATLADPDATDRALAAAPPTAQTLHRLLGWRPGGDFRHGKGAPLPHAAVIVDEASMVDLALMERLLRAARDGARVILLGDAHQLPSVDAGAVLAELVELAQQRGAPWAISLTESHRMRADDPDGRAVLEAARAVDAGQPHRLFDGADRLISVRASVADAARRGVELIHVETGAQLGAALDAWWQHYLDDGRFLALTARAYRRELGQWRADDDAALRELLAIHERRRLLTVTRGLDTGAAAINARLHRAMLRRATAELAPELVPGEPVLITANDYQRGLYNGDQGVIVRVVDADTDGAQRYRAVFRRAGELVPLPIDAVRSSLELAWAMTVHKSQGSELDHVALVLPADDLPLCTRELVYTALTRARRGAMILGTADALTRAVERTTARQSGLAARLALGLDA